MGSRAFVASGVFSPLRPEEDGPADPQHPFAVSGLRRYARDGIIGIGAMGRVLKAWDRRLRRFVAVK